MNKLEFDRDAAVQMYIDGKSPNAVGKAFGVSHKVIGLELRSRGIEPRNQIAYRRKYTVNQNIFNVIDSEEKAYWLGFIATDGNVSEAQLRISLQRGDKTHLEKFRSFIGSDAPINDVVSKTPSGKSSLQSSIVICSRPIVSALYNQGITENKSLTIKPIYLNDDLNRHYWRGIVDGDGYISTNLKMIGIAGNCFMCQEFSNQVNKLTNRYFPVRTYENRAPQCSIWTIIGVKKVVDWLYKDSVVNLDRKMKLAQEIING